MAKCSDCGYLAVRNVDSRDLEEAEESFRRKGTGPLAEIYSGKGHLRHEKQPLCFAMVHSFRDDFEKAIKEGKPENDRVRQIIQKERPCDEFTEWKQGCTPKEHREMLDRQWMLDYRKKREQEDREWRAKEEKERRKWQQEQS